jgi:hypothetical protein
MKNFLSVDKIGKPVGSILVDQHTTRSLSTPSKGPEHHPGGDRCLLPTPQVHIEALIVEATRRPQPRIHGQRPTAVRRRQAGRPAGNIAPNPGRSAPREPRPGNVVNNPLSTRRNQLWFIYQNVGKASAIRQLMLQDEGKVNISPPPRSPP